MFFFVSTEVLKNIMRYEKKFFPEPIGVWLDPTFIVLLSKPENVQVVILK